MDSRGAFPEQIAHARLLGGRLPLFSGTKLHKARPEGIDTMLLIDQLYLKILMRIFQTNSLTVFRPL